MPAGEYAVSVDAGSGYVASFSGSCDAVGSVTLVKDQEVTCTVTLEDIAPTLRVITGIVNDDGGAAAVGNVLTHVRHDGEDVAGSPQPGIGEPNGSLYTLDAGTYVVSGDGMPGYDGWVSDECGENGSITLGLDEDAICVVTADDV